jgi:hypothetical protein
MEILGSIAISVGIGISKGIQYSIAIVIVYFTLKVLTKVFGPISLFKK